MFAKSLVHTASLAALAAIIASTAASQSVGTVAPRDDAFSVTRRSSFSLSASQSRPQGALGRNIGRGYGLDGAYLLRLDRAGYWSLRASVGAVSYAGETRRVPLSETVGGRVSVDMTTSNYIVPMSVGPQLSWPTGIVRPYVNAGVGAQLFLTESRVQGTADRTVLASTTNHSSVAASWTIGGGVYVPLNAGKTRVDLDLGAHYIVGATQRYLGAGSIVDLPGAQVSITPMESRTRMAIIRIGARVRL
jgi:opacity protein-like surface antigen